MFEVTAQVFVFIFVGQQVNSQKYFFIVLFFR